jgi:DNA (cytosine-5)-methyltransferase 1
VKLGGLFSGVGGFELAWTQLGHEVAWMCEIDKNARKVLAARFPGVPIYEDVEQLDPAEVEAVDVLTGGSPCQGFSVAGQRFGMEHGESRLFADYIRIMNGLAERGLQWALWENVPGVLSIKNPDGERTFTHVIGALAGTNNPVRLDPRRKWNTGLAAGDGRAVSWRILDSKYFGVAQRRRRVFACVAFGDSAANRAGRALLAQSESCSGHFDASQSQGQGFTGGSSEGVGASCAFVADAEPSPKMLFVRGGVEFDRHGRRAGKGPLISDNESATLDSGNHWTLFQPKVFRKSSRPKSNTDVETWVDDGQANTLNAFDMGPSRTTHAVIEEERYGVRRLTPVECERLQSFPDGWTEPAETDSARYRAMGNAVTVNTVRWVLGRILYVG